MHPTSPHGDLPAEHLHNGYLLIRTRWPIPRHVKRAVVTSSQQYMEDTSSLAAQISFGLVPAKMSTLSLIPEV